MRRVLDLRTRAAAVLGALAIVATSLVVATPGPGGALTVTTSPWRPMTTPVSSSMGSSMFNGVSCPPTPGRFCMAVGSSDSGVLAEVWRGSWKVTPTPAPGAGAQFTGVSCTGPSSCMAVGNGPGIFADYWNGSTWSVSMSSSVNAALNGVSCDASGCLAVGFTPSFVAVQQTSTAFAVHWDGHSWTTVSPAGLNGGFAGTSCGAPGQCLSVGMSMPGGFDTNTAIGALYNGTWTAEPPRNPAPQNQLSGVSCVSTTPPLTCLAVGWSAGAGLMAERWNGSTGSWAVTAPPVVPDPSGDGYGNFGAVSCPAAAWCVAVGSFADQKITGGFPAALAEVWNGSSWQEMSTRPLWPLLPLFPSYAQFNGVSCPTTKFCVGVGYKYAANTTNSPAGTYRAAAAFWGSEPL